MERLSRMAESAPVRAASATASRFPVARPKPRDRTTIPLHTQDIAISISSFCSINIQICEFSFNFFLEELTFHGRV